jgi:hypothetical protein
MPAVDLPHFVEIAFASWLEKFVAERQTYLASAARPKIGPAANDQIARFRRRFAIAPLLALREGA